MPRRLEGGPRRLERPMPRRLEGPCVPPRVEVGLRTRKEGNDNTEEGNGGDTDTYAQSSYHVRRNPRHDY
jgi:hypothetical protein